MIVIGCIAWEFLVQSQPRHVSLFHLGSLFLLLQPLSSRLQCTVVDKSNCNWTYQRLHPKNKSCFFLLHFKVTTSLHSLLLSFNTWTTYGCGTQESIYLIFNAFVKSIHPLHGCFSSSYSVVVVLNASTPFNYQTNSAFHIIGPWQKSICTQDSNSGKKYKYSGDPLRQLQCRHWFSQVIIQQLLY